MQNRMNFFEISACWTAHLIPPLNFPNRVYTVFYTNSQRIEYNGVY